MKYNVVNTCAEKTFENKLHIAPLVAAACLLFGLSLGIRMNYGILLNAYADRAGLPYAEISLVVAVGELVYGLAQPLFGIAAIKRSNGFVLKLGLYLLALGFILSAFTRSVPVLALTLGGVLSAGTGAICFGIVMGSISPFIPKSQAAAASGIVNASSGIGSSLMSPLIESLMANMGLTATMLLLSLPALVLLPTAYWLSRVNSGHTHKNANNETAPPISMRRTLRQAARLRTYQYLMLGFATCGFHMSLIQNHLYSQLISYGIDKQTAAFTYTAFGIGTMIGALICGLICAKLSLKNVLGSIYLLRVVIIAVFFFIPPNNMSTAVIFTVALGLTGDATVTPTSEIISRKFGSIHMAFLFGIVFVCHQIGAFASTWFAGLLLTLTGSYLWIWLIDLGLCALAAFASYRIKISDCEIKE